MIEKESTNNLTNKRKHLSLRFGGTCLQRGDGGGGSRVEARLISGIDFRVRVAETTGKERATTLLSLPLSLSRLSSGRSRRVYTRAQTSKSGRGERASLPPELVVLSLCVPLEMTWFSCGILATSIWRAGAVFACLHRDVKLWDMWRRCAKFLTFERIGRRTCGEMHSCRGFDDVYFSYFLVSR